MTEIYCNHEGCLHLKLFEDGPKHIPGFNAADWDPGYAGICTKPFIGVKVRELHFLADRGGHVHLVLPECQAYARRRDWRMHLPYPDEIEKRGGRELGSQEHDSSR